MRDKGQERRRQEQPAVKTTIVGGRPPGPGKAVGEIPRGIEVLVKKASVDADFKSLLLEKRAEAARDIGLELTPAEAMMLDAVPAAQLEAIIATTSVSPISRAAFLGKAAAVMLAALGAEMTASAGLVATRGIAPDYPNRRQRFVVYRETNYKGDVTYGVLEQQEYNKRLAAIKATNRVIRQAYAAAARAWREDEKHKGTPFPLRTVMLLRCTREATYGDRDRAEEVLKRRQETLERKRAAAREAAERRLAAMSDAAREREEQKAKLLKEAEALFEKELAKLLAPPKPPAEPITRGIRPGRPPASFGIQP